MLPFHGRQILWLSCCVGFVMGTLCNKSLQVTLGNFPVCLREVKDAVELAGPLGTPLGLAQWKRASSRGETGTSGFLSISDSDRRVPAVLGQESQA